MKIEKGKYEEWSRKKENHILGGCSYNFKVKELGDRVLLSSGEI